MKKLQSVSESKLKRSERGEEEYSPYGAPECPYDPGGKMAVPCGVNIILRRSETSVSTKQTPGGWSHEQVRPGDVGRNWERQTVVEGVGYEGIGHGNDDSGENVETNAPDRVKRVRRHGR